MRFRFAFLFGGGIAALTLATLPAFAHHGWGGQSTESFSLSGKVHKGVSLAGPHATMQIEDAEGQIWDITLAPPARTSGAGLGEDTLAVGTEVTITGNRNLDASRFEVKTARVTANGKNYDVYPNRL